MLILGLPKQELWDEEHEKFIKYESMSLELEHSLVSLSKWEQKHHKAFLGRDEKTDEEALSYVESMIISPNLPPDLLLRITDDHIDAINNYINDSMTATTFRISQRQGGSEIITNELIYYWMFTLEIPLECENWHLSRLFTLIRVFEAKNSKPKKRSEADIMAENRRVNDKRRAQYGSRG